MQQPTTEYVELSGYPGWKIKKSQHEELLECAKRLGRSYQSLVHEALTDYLAEVERTGQI